MSMILPSIGINVVPFHRGNLLRGRRSKFPPPTSEPIQVRSAGAWRFQWHECVLCRRDLTRSDLAVAGVIMHHYRMERGGAQISHTTLARKAGCSRGSVNTAIKRLVDRGFVSITNADKRKPDGSREVNLYRLTHRSGGVQ